MDIKNKFALHVGAVVFAASAFVVGMTSPAVASGSYCKSGNQLNSCTAVNGYSSVINWASAATTATSRIVYVENNFTYTATAHVELVSPSGAELCNSSTVTMNQGASTSCTWNAGGNDYQAGNYCTIVWEWLPYGFGGSWEWRSEGPTDCLYVS